jgi:cytochrome P450
MNELWKNPEEFNPDRFKNDGILIPYQFNPFGIAGGRVCPGRFLTLTDIYVNFSILLKYFKMSLVDYNKDPEKVYGSVVYPSHEIYVTVEKRI